MSLPDSPRVGILPPARALASSALELTRRLTWHTLHPRARQRFLSRSRPLALRRIEYRTHDGWSAPLFHLPPALGGPGEPVLLAHALGLGSDAYRGGEKTLAARLSRAGFSVYLFSHRGDREATGHGRMDFDAIVEADVPAAIQAILLDSDAERVHWVGHHLGGQLGLVAAGRGEQLASLVALSAPVLFDPATPQWRRLRMAAKLLPGGWRVPTDQLARLALPFVGDETVFGEASCVAARDLLEHGTEPISTALLRQMMQWMESGALCSRAGRVDYTATFRAASVPLLVVLTEDSPDEQAVTAPLYSWRHADALALRVPGSTIDLALGSPLDPVVDWLIERRALAWPLTVDASTAYAS